MNADLLGPIFAASLFAIFAAFMLSKFIKFGGFAAAFYGARIKREVGEVGVSGYNVPNIRLKVHALESDGQSRAVGLELIAKGIGPLSAGYQRNYVTLSAPAADKLAAVIRSMVQK